MDYYNDLQKICDKLDATKSELLEAITILRIDVAALQIKSGIWGFAAGSIPTLIFFLIQFMSKK